ncbi:MAG: lspA [Acidimicrobiales bacterium]|nr:lspA [Acidimicrobiales bacterium]
MRGVQERRAVGSPLSRSARRPALIAGVAAATLAGDQLTKWWAVHALAHRDIHVVGSLRLALTRNAGGAFGLGAGVIPVLALAAVAIVMVVVARSEATRRLPVAIAVGLVLGGAFGNLADRVFRSPGGLSGKVIDFIDLRWWPVFNVADTAISIGCVALVVLIGRPARSER